jgi:hypothetical protein
MLREMIKSIHMYACHQAIASGAGKRRKQATHTGRTDASRVGGVGPQKEEKEIGVGQVGGMNVSWPCLGL